MPRHSSLNPNTPPSAPETSRISILEDQLHALREIARQRGINPDPRERGITTEVLGILIEEYTEDHEGFERKNGLIQFSESE